MTNAAFYLHPQGYDTSGPALLGRLSAGESFLRGYLRHADVERYYFWNVAGSRQADLDALLERVHPPKKPITWIAQTDRRGLGQAGVLNMPVPGLADEAWRRRPFGPRTYAICGITPIENMLEINEFDKTRPADARTPDHPVRNQQRASAAPNQLLASVMDAGASPRLLD